jgi:hypothetical protein
VIVLRVLPFVLAASLRNRVRHQLRRLRQPKYALATAVGLAWFWFYAGRHLVAGPRRVPTLPASVAPALVIAVAAGGTALLLLAWIFRARHQALAMSEAEVQFLFPAPLSRVDVLHYRVLQLLAYGLVGTAFTTLVFGRAASGSPLLFALGAWIAFGTADLHRLGVALTWAAVGEGWSGVRRRAGTFGLLAVAIAFTAWAATRVEVPPFTPSAEWLGELARAVLDSPLRWPLWPGMALAGLALSRTAGEFAAHLPGALAVLAVHYVWVIRSGVAFEEAVLESAGADALAIDTGGFSVRNTNDLAAGADVLLHDAQYTPEELSTHRGWGHSSYRQAIDCAKLAGVKKLVLTHHDPDHDDAVLAEIERHSQQLFPNCVLARDNMTLVV